MHICAQHWCSIDVLTKNGITFTICGHFCAVKSCYDITSILWDVHTAKILTLTKTLVIKTLKMALMYGELASSNKVVLDHASQLKFSEF